MPNQDPYPPPSPEMLAAYADGEFEGNAALASRKRFIEDWLERHPEAAAEILAWRRLKCQWQKTSASEPDDAAWAKVWAGVERNLDRPAVKPQRTAPGWWRRGIAAAVVLLALSASAWFTAQHLARLHVAHDSGQPVGEADEPHGNNVAPDALAQIEPFPVASDEDVTVLQIDADDVGTLVVGRMPVSEPMAVTRPGDVSWYSFEPDPGDSMLPDVHMDSGSAMLWSRVSREMYEP